jgi:hypothetical protein
MRTRTLLIGSLFLLLLPVSALAQQGWSGETEVGTDGKGENFFSQYVFYDVENYNVLVRYFWVNDALNRGEFAIGPTFKIKQQNVLKLQFGGTTDKDVMVAGLIVTKVANRGILYIADAKFSTTDSPNTLYQKVFVALNARGSFQFRAEHLQVGSVQGFLRLGAEYQQSLPRQTQLFVAPFYDPIKKTLGIQGGFRFF